MNASLRYQIVLLNGPKGYDTANTTLFNAEEYAALYPQKERYLALAVNEQKETVAKIQLFIHEDLAFNPIRAPFGGIEINENYMDAPIGEMLFQLLKCVKDTGIERVRIVPAPACYGKEKHEIIHRELAAQGFEPVFTDINFHQIIQSEKSFAEIIHQKERNRLHKCRREGFYFCENDEYDLREVHEFIKQSRIRKGYPLTLDLESFLFLFASLPHRYLIFSVRSAAHRLAAVSVAVAVSEEVLYNFYLADHADFLSYSPAVMLHEGLYDFCQHNAIKLLDMGIATDMGIANEGLMNFKKRIGGVAGPKITYEKVF